MTPRGGADLSNATPRGTLSLKLNEVWTLDFELSLSNPRLIFWAEQLHQKIALLM